MIHTQQISQRSRWATRRLRQPLREIIAILTFRLPATHWRTQRDLGDSCHIASSGFYCVYKHIVLYHRNRHIATQLVPTFCSLYLAFSQENVTICTQI